MHMSAIDEPKPSDLIDLFVFLQGCEDAMSVPELYGFLTAIVSAPSPLMPSEWQREVFGEPEFESEEEVRKIFGTLMGLDNQIIHALSQGVILGLDDLGDGAAVSAWSAGYLRAAALDADVADSMREQALETLEDTVLETYDHWCAYRRELMPMGSTVVRG